MMNQDNNYKFGFTAFITQLNEMLDYASQSGMIHLEINFSKLHTPVNSFSDVLIDKINLLCKTNNIELSFHLPFTENISDIIPMIRRKSISNLKNYIRIAGKVQAKLITIHPGIFYWFPVERRMRDKALRRLLKGLNEILITCSECNVRIALENLVPIPQGSEFFFLGDNINDFRFVFDNIQSEYLGFCLDTGHANVAEGVVNYIEALGDRMINIHFHDNNGSNDNHLVVGEGNINWDETGAAIRKMSYKGPFISECRGIKPEVAAEKLKSYLAN